jgi:hypothetical protein
MEDKICEFLRKRGIEEAVITAMNDSKVIN